MAVPGWARIGVRVGWMALGLALVALLGVGLVLWQVEQDEAAACEAVLDLRGDALEGFRDEAIRQGATTTGPECGDASTLGSATVTASFDRAELPVELLGISYTVDDLDGDRRRCVNWSDGVQVELVQLGGQLLAVATGVDDELRCNPAGYTATAPGQP